MDSQISGGSYESLAFLDEEGTRDQSHTSSDAAAEAAEDEDRAYSSSVHRSERPARREAIFSSFCSHARSAVDNEEVAAAGRRPLIMCTGGFKTLRGMNTALHEDGIDLIGLGRAAAVDPDLPDRLLGTKQRKGEGDMQRSLDRCVQYEMSGGQWLRKLLPLQLVGGGMTTKWHQGQMMLLAEGREPMLDCSLERLLLREVWTGIGSGGRAAVVGVIAAAAAMLVSRTY